jgi:hypothetical protein
MTVKTSPERAPAYALYREGITSADTIANVEKIYGCNSSMYKDVHVQVIPASGVTTNVAIYWWSEQANKFIQEHTAITKASVGAGVPYEFTVEAKGRLFFVAVTATDGSVDIAVSGFEQEQFS